MDLTAEDIIDVLYKRIKGANIPITGKVYNDQYSYVRPANSDKEDIVINSLPIVNNEFQETVANVNLHFPRIKPIDIDGVTTYTFDRVRINGLVKQLKAALNQFKDSIWVDGWNYRVQQDGPIPDENIYNIRVEFINENFN